MSRASRIRIEHVHCAVNGTVTVGQVQLGHHGRVKTGLASSHTTDGAWRQVVAEATLSAVRGLVNGHPDVTLDAVAELHTGRHPIVVVTMAIGKGKQEIFLSGTASLGADQFTAVARAVLHGLNRWVEPFLAAAPARGDDLRGELTSA